MVASKKSARLFHGTIEWIFTYWCHKGGKRESGWVSGVSLLALFSQLPNQITKVCSSRTSLC